MKAFSSLDIIIPCFNPRSGWEKVLAESMLTVKKLLPPNTLRSVIVVNDGSLNGFSDSGLEFLTGALPEVKLIEYQRNRGKGYAVRTGVRSSDADLHVYTDVDVPYTEQAVIRLYHLLAKDEADIVIASRGESYYSSLSVFRRWLSKSLKWLNGLLFGLKIKDTQGGLKGFNDLGKKVFLRTSVNRYLFDLEFVQKASKTDLRLSSLDVELKPQIVLPSLSVMVLAKELHNFINLLIRR